MAELNGLSLAAARNGLRARSFSARELTQSHLDAMAALNPALNAYITETPDMALLQADAADAAYAAGSPGPLAGIPLGIKDLFCTAGVRTTAGSRILDDFVPPYESTVTANLLRDGAVFLGKTNLDEFAMGSSNMTSAYGPVTNPWTRADGAKLVPGGSSGGSAAAVAAGIAMAATGTDTGGSIRQPASFCGIVGMKPTYGRCSRFGRRRLRVLARPSRPLRPHRRGHGHPAWLHGRLRPARQHLRRPPRAGFCRRLHARRARPAHRRAS